MASWIFEEREAIQDQAAAPPRWEVVLRIIIAVAPVVVVQLALLLMVTRTDQMVDLLQSISGDPAMSHFFSIGFYMNAALTAIIVSWRLHKVENPYLAADIYGPLFLRAKYIAVIALILFGVAIYPTAASILQPELTKEYLSLLVKSPIDFLMIAVMVVYIAVAVPALHDRRRLPPGTNFLLFAVSGRDEIKAVVREMFANVHVAVLGLLIFLALVFIFFPSYAVGEFGGPVALFTFVWTAFIVVFWFTDLKPIGRIAGIVLLVIVLTSPSFGIREMRQAQGLIPSASDLRPADEGPIFVVASDGGGIRSAYWTTSLLGAIAAHPEFKGFADRIIALGGASGGSVGVGVFAALKSAGVPEGELRAKAAEILSVDYISIAASYLVWRDFLASAVCLRPWVRALFGSCGDDRMTALERRMEEAFRDATGGDTLAGPMVNRPLLYFNSTEVGTGRAYVFGTRDPEFAETSDTPPVFVAANDITMSTAMFISARFPVVSPDGRINLRYDGPNAASPAHADGSQAVTLIDGGYADNTGTLAITRLLQTAPLAGNKRIYAISISNDPGRRGGTADELAEALACERTEPAASSGNFARLLGSPLATLDGIRAQASERRRAELSAAASGRFQLAPLLGCKDDVPIPLGWTLSAEARRQLDHRADQLLTPGSPLYTFLKKAYACAGSEASADGDNCL